MGNKYQLESSLIESNIGFVYITINKKTGKAYIGKKHFDRQWEQYLGSGKILKHSIKKHGEEAFYKIIVGFAKTEEQLDELEKLLIDVNIATTNDNFYNIAAGGHGGNTFAGYSDEEFEKYCNSLRGENNPYYGHHHSDETIKKILDKRKSRIYHPLSNEAKRQISNTKKEWFKTHRHQCSKEFKVIFKNGDNQYFSSFINMRKGLGIEKRDYYRWKQLDIPKYKKKEKKELFESIKRIYENGSLSYDYAWLDLETI